MGCCKSKGSCKTGLTEEQRKVLEAVASREEPCTTKEIAEATGLTSNQVSCRIRSLKGKGYLDSPARCKYVVTEQGRAALAQGE